MNVIDYLKSKRESFGAKILFIVTIFILVMYLSFSLFFVYYQRKVLNDHLLYEGRQLAGLVAYSSRLGVFAENQEMLKGPVDGALEYVETMLVQLYEADGGLLLTRAKPGMEDMIAPAGQDDTLRVKAIQAVNETGAVANFENSENIDFWAPVLSGEKYTEEDLFFDNGSRAAKDIIGYVRIVLTKEELNKMMNEVVRKSVIVPVLFLIAGWIISYFVIRGITSPLKKLTRGVRALETAGEFEKVPVASTDEVGRLASAFNDMADTLKRRAREKGELEERLRHSQKMEAIGTFSGGIAHDFNNILTVIKSYGQMIRKKGLSGVEKTFLDNMLASAEKASLLTKSLLAFSRKQIIRPRPLKVSTLFSGLMETLKMFLDESIELILDDTDEDMTVMADRAYLEQVFINLVTNARDAMPEGGRLTISVRAAFPGGVVPTSVGIREGVPFAVFSFTDTGMGMDRETRERIFDPFFTTKEVGKGTGLGLSLAYGIVAQHGGHIDVRSRPGRGTTFDIYIPRSDAEPEEVDVEAPGEIRGGTETVLLAEDDKDVRNLVAMVLHKYGYTVLEAADGEEALAVYNKNRDSVDVLLLDIMMPKKKGPDVYAEISRTNPGIRALFISGYAAGVLHDYNNAAKEGPLQEEGTSVLHKPIMPDQLLRKVRDVLDG